MLLLNLVKPLKDILTKWHFNTSNVVIKQKTNILTYHEKTISIHLMLLLNKHGAFKQTCRRKISIHLMLLLNKKKG